MRPVQSQNSEGILRECQPLPNTSHGSTPATISTTNNSSFCELLCNNNGLFLNGQDTSLMLLNPNNNTTSSTNPAENYICNNQTNISFENLFQLEMLNHQSTTPPQVNNPQQNQHTQQLTINMNSSWNKTHGPTENNHHTNFSMNSPTNGFNQPNIQLLHLLSQQHSMQQAPHVTTIGMENSAESSILQLLQTSLNNQRTLSNNHPMLDESTNINSILSNQQLMGSMNNQSSDVFSSSSQQASIIINPNEFSTLISHPSSEHTSTNKLKDLLKPVDMSTSDLTNHHFISPSSLSEPISTTLLQQGSVEDMVGETTRSSFQSSPTLQESEEEKPHKGEKKKREKKTTKEISSAGKKPNKKSKMELHDISITIPQHLQQASNQHVSSSPLTAPSNSPNSTMPFSGQMNCDVTGEKSQEKFSRPLLKNETVLCENNKFKNNYFVFSGTPSQGKRKSTTRTHSSLCKNTTASSNSEFQIQNIYPTNMDTTSSQQLLLNPPTPTSAESILIYPSSNKSPEVLQNKWLSFVTTLSDLEKHSLMQTLLESMIKK